MDTYNEQVLIVAKWINDGMPPVPDTDHLIAATLAAHAPEPHCLDCDGEGRTPNGSCTGDTAGGWADTCDTCGGTGKGGHAVTTVSLPEQAAPAPAPAGECPYCGSTKHTLPRCAAFASDSGTPLLKSMRAQITELETRLAEYRHVNSLATAALEQYHALYGALPSEPTAHAWLRRGEGE